jgi:LmbE family N-acetylglucosaminyl deacetylase
MTIRNMRFLRFLALGIGATTGLAGRVLAQLEPPSTGGIVALEQELRMLGHNKRVLVIGAHPDDEDTELLTLLVRGMGAEAAYLSLNRGEGGQNLIGSELGEGLGLIRTEELLAARRLDGAHQFFTRAYDFGYSKTLEETWRFWPKDSVLKDVVRIVREFQPQIIVSIFSGTPRDGHGQHQAAGWAAREAFRVAGDSTAFRDLASEGLSAWTPAKLYQSTRFDSAATTLTLDGGQLDDLVGQSYHQIAMRGRSMHKSQDMGQLQRMGPSAIRLRLIEDRSGKAADGLFSGIDTTSAPGLESVAPTIDSARASSNPAEIRRHLDAAIVPAVRIDCHYDASSGFCEHFSRAVAIANSLVFDAVADDDRVVPGDTLMVTISAWNGSDTAQQVSFGVASSLSFLPVSGSADNRIPGRAVASWVVKIPIPEHQEFASPYFLRQPRQGAMYQWGAKDPKGEPFEEALLRARFDGLGFNVWRDVVFRKNDQARGEVRLPVEIVPRIDVKLDPANEVWSTAPNAHDFQVTLTHGAKDSTSGSVTLEVPAGWPAVQPQRFSFTAEDERENFRFSIRPSAGLRPGKYEIRAVATDARGGRYDQGVFTVDYPHIRPRSWTQSSAATINVAPLDMARLKRVGYIRGAADMVPEALTSVGVPVELIDRAMLERGDLAAFDAIVVGSRAYETDSALVENNGRLLAYARNGGLVIIQYQQQPFFRGNFAPFPMTVGGQPLVLDSTGTNGARVGPPVSHDRVTDETAPVRFLDPQSAIANRPNRIGPEDWNGWVQERGLYFAHTWDDQYRPVLEMADPGEAPLRGGLLIAKYGKGTYVYTGLAFFRELPAGVPGAFRLFANLLALGESTVP